MSSHRSAAVVLLAATSLGLAACSGSTTPAETVTVVVTEDAEPSEEPTPEPTETEAAEPTPTLAASAEATYDGPPVIVGGGASEQQLTLADIFSAYGWEEGAIEVPNSDGPVQRAIYTEIGSSNPRSIELRFRQQRGTLNIEVAQALMSRNSDVPVEWRLSADGRLVETQTLLFNERRTMSVDLTGVSAVILEAHSSRGETSGNSVTTPVIVGLTITPE